MNNKHFFSTLAGTSIGVLALIVLDPFGDSGVLKAGAYITLGATEAWLAYKMLKQNTQKARAKFVIAATCILIGLMALEPAELIRGPDQPVAEDWA